MFDKVSDRILELLKHYGMKQIDLARVCDISANAITNYIKKNRLPDTESIFKIAKALNTTVEWILTGEGDMFQQEQPEPLPVAMDFEVDELDAEQKELLFVFAHLDDVRKYAVKDFARYQLETLPRNAPNERPKGAGKLSCFRPFSDPQNGVNSA